jgi:sentrin-specific protease 1
MLSLEPGEWLNDEIINFFFSMLMTRDELVCGNSNLKRRSCFFHSFFLTRLLDEWNNDPDLAGKYDYHNVRAWSGDVPGKDLFQLDKIFYPINVGDMHWVCAVVFMQKKKIQMFDSMHSSGLGLISHVFNYLKDEHMTKHGCPLPDAHEWRLVENERSTPSQKNGECCFHIVHEPAQHQIEIGF